MDTSPRFEFLPHTADVGVLAYGSSLREVFASAAYAMFTIMVDVAGVREALSRDVEVTAPDREALLVEWLNELLYLFDAEHLVFRRFAIHFLDETRLQATAWGEEVDPARHQLRTGVKATTYHLLMVECGEAQCRARVVFDV